MHSRIGPWQEAIQVYINQSRIQELAGVQDSDPITVYDVGLGIAANALALVSTYAQIQTPKRELQIFSFENDLAGLRTAMRHEEQFPFVKENRGKLETLLDQKTWQKEGVEWRLFEGDFFESLGAVPSADLIFYDFYSARADPDLWSVEAFKKIISHQKEKDCLLLTYSSATSVRVALLLAGFFVGKGTRTDVKNETTVASTKRSLLKSPLGPEWLSKLERSKKLHPCDMDANLTTASELRERIAAHSQFR